MSQDAAQFVFMTCRAGAEGVLKQEVAHFEPAWRPSFSRPGLLTFKNGAELKIDDQKLAERNWTFAYTHGVSLGRLAGDQLADLVRQFWEQPEVVAIATTGAAIDLHVWQREPAAADDDGLSTFITPLCREIEAALRAAAPEQSTLAKDMAAHRKG